MLELPTSEFIAKFKPAYGKNWIQETRDIMIVDAEILADLRSNLPIRDPVIVDMEDMSVRDGMHRTVLSILAGLPTIKYMEDYPDDSSYIDLGLEFEVIDGYDDNWYDWVVSFKVDDTTWVNIDYGVSGPDELIMYSNWKGDVDQLINLLIDRCAIHGMHLKFRKSSILIEDSDE